jgi:hypothetical protein
MNWFTASIIVAGLFYWLGRKSRSVRPKEASGVRQPEISRQERIRKAIDTYDLDEMEKILKEESPPLDRHRLLSALIKKVYALRSQPPMRTKLYEYGRIYLDEFDKMLPQIKADSEEREVEAPVFKWLAIAMEEDGKFDEAVALCRRAMDCELDDGTKTGFPGRLLRIQKKQNVGY